MKLGQYITDDDVWELEPHKNWEQNYLFWCKKYMQDKTTQLSSRFVENESRFDKLIDSMDTATNIEELKDTINAISREKAKGAKSYFIALYKFYHFLVKVEAKNLKQIENKVVKAFIISLRDEVPQLSEVTKGNMLVRVKNFFKYIDDHNSSNGVAHTFDINLLSKDILKIRERKIDIISPDKEYTDFLMGVDEIKFKHNDTRNKLLLKVALFTGMRVSEITYLKYKDISIDGKSFAFNIVGKGNKKRTLYVSKRDIIDLWNRYLKEKPITDDNMYVFPNSRGEPLADRIVSNYVRKILALKNIKTTKKGLHLIRHSLSTKLIFSGEHSLEDVSALLGHENIATTQIYTHITNEHIKKTSKGISDVLNNRNKKK